jgi:hypothetical protein
MFLIFVKDNNMFFMGLNENLFLERNKLFYESKTNSIPKILELKNTLLLMLILAFIKIASFY